VAITALMSPTGILALMASNWTVASAVCPSRAVTSGETEVTDGRGWMAASARSIRAVTAGARIGAAEWNTTWASSPAWAGKRWARMFWACWDWPTPPKSFSKRDPAVAATAMMAITPAIQPSSTIRRWS
jgi:hypothetical protein